MNVGRLDWFSSQPNRPTFEQFKNVGQRESVHIWNATRDPDISPKKPSKNIFCFYIAHDILYLYFLMIFCEYWQYGKSASQLFLVPCVTRAP